MKLCVLEVDIMPEPLRPGYGTFAQMIERWLGPALPEAGFYSSATLSGEPPPPPHRYDGYIVTGSPYGVYQQLPWMRALSEFLGAARDAGRPVFGICFGHQIMAEAYGGGVALSDHGWNIGAQPYRFDAAAAPADGAVLVYHQDRVVVTPPQARVAARGARDVVGALEYPFAALSVQYHPEFTREFVNDLLRRHGDRLPDGVAAAAAASLAEHATDGAATARWAAAFFRRWAGAAGCGSGAGVQGLSASRFSR